MVGVLDGVRLGVATFLVAMWSTTLGTVERLAILGKLERLPILGRIYQAADRSFFLHQLGVTSGSEQLGSRCIARRQPYTYSRPIQYKQLSNRVVGPWYDLVPFSPERLACDVGRCGCNIYGDEVGRYSVSYMSDVWLGYVRYQPDITTIILDNIYTLYILVSL